MAVRHGRPPRASPGSRPGLAWHREVIPGPLADAAGEVAGRALDLGCGTGEYATCLASRLHGVAADAARRAYKRRVLGWLAPGGRYVLSHFLRRHPFDWRPMGPRRRTRAEVVGLFAPDLTEVGGADEVVPTLLPIGPRVNFGHYRFRRSEQPVSG